MQEYKKSIRSAFNFLQLQTYKYETRINKNDHAVQELELCSFFLIEYSLVLSERDLIFSVNLLF